MTKIDQFLSVIGREYQNTTWKSCVKSTPLMVHHVMQRMGKKLSPVKKTAKALKDQKVKEAPEEMAEKTKRRKQLKNAKKIVEFEKRNRIGVNMRTLRQIKRDGILNNPSPRDDEKSKKIDEYYESLDPGSKEVYA